MNPSYSVSLFLPSILSFLVTKSVKPRSRILNVTHNNEAVINSTRFCSSGSLNEGHQGRAAGRGDFNFFVPFFSSRNDKSILVTASQWNLFRNSRSVDGRWTVDEAIFLLLQLRNSLHSGSLPRPHAEVSLYDSPFSSCNNGNECPVQHLIS